jgi:hypothetical protein
VGPPLIDLTLLIAPVALVSSTRRCTKSFQSSLAAISGCKWANHQSNQEIEVPGTHNNLAASSSNPACARAVTLGIDTRLLEGKSGSDTRLLASSDILLKACKFDNSFAISSGEEGDEPSSSSSNPDNGSCAVGSCGGGDGCLNLGRFRVGLFFSRSDDEDEELPEDGLRWYVDPWGVDCILELLRDVSLVVETDWTGCTGGLGTRVAAPGVRTSFLRNGAGYPFGGPIVEGEEVPTGRLEGGDEEVW